jgi:NAD-dependent deacetylase
MNIVFFTGAGMSEESGIPTFRTGEDCIWNKYDPDIYCHIKSWPQHKEKMLEFGNELRQSIEKCLPNEGHLQIAELEKKHDVTIITTNVDDLHERAGSSNIFHIHGSMFESRSSLNHNLTYKQTKDILLGDKCEKGSQLRYNIVMFGEMPHYLNEAKKIINKADVLIVVGTSLNVYPAAGLVFEAKCEKKYYVDPSGIGVEGFKVINKKASEGLIDIYKQNKWLKVKNTIN